MVSMTGEPVIAHETGRKTSKLSKQHGSSPAEAGKTVFWDAGFVPPSIFDSGLEQSKPRQQTIKAING